MQFQKCQIPNDDSWKANQLKQKKMKWINSSKSTKSEASILYCLQKINLKIKKKIKKYDLFPMNNEWIYIKNKKGRTFYNWD